MQEFYSDYKPDYVIKQYTEEIYGICRFNRSGYEGIYCSREEDKSYDKKLDNAFSRARSMVLQYGLCNQWDYFCTLTLDKRKYDRYDLDRFKLDLGQFVRDMRKQYKAAGSTDRLRYLFVPEMHHDGAWHMHGLLAGIPHDRLSKFESGIHPEYLVKHGYFNWSDYAERFGFVSLGAIRDHYATVLYCVKYIDKSVEDLADQIGKHLYMVSRGLNKAVNCGEVYGPEPELDAVLDWHGTFCSTGIVKDKNWLFPAMYAEVDEWLKPKSYELEKELESFNPALIDPTYQMSLDDLLIMG